MYLAVAVIISMAYGIACSLAFGSSGLLISIPVGIALGAVAAHLGSN